MTYEEALKEIVLSDDRYVVLTAENKAALRNISPALGDRFIDVGIAEQSLVGIAAGLALSGRVPIVHALAAFLTMRAYEFIRTDVGYGRLPVKLVGGVPGILSEANGPTHQALEDAGLMRMIPGVEVFCPSDEEDLVLGLRAVLESPAPAYIRHNGLRPPAASHASFVLGKAETIFEGDDLAILASGPLLAQAVETHEILEEHGLHSRLVNMRTLAPADRQALEDAARCFPLVVTVEDHFLQSGLSALFRGMCFDLGLRPRHLPFGFDDRFFAPALLKQVLSHEHLTGPSLADRILEVWNTNIRKDLS